jgi:hypothetical protein
MPLKEQHPSPSLRTKTSATDISVVTPTLQTVPILPTLPLIPALPKSLKRRPDMELPLPWTRFLQRPLSRGSEVLFLRGSFFFFPFFFFLVSRLVWMSGWEALVILLLVLVKDPY